ncbi:response regulator [Glaciecola sp. MH2013]|uniref:response regulator n=1 Tax=Glaciecola sp. MH2013 TaxID=2785524 RepID=UPI0018A0E52C|nr:response regulator [Glaciecola sp. MH2013]MBF7072977.1 response regulator [Glaciecola sp. MH2013]
MTTAIVKQVNKTKRLVVVVSTVILLVLVGLVFTKIALERIQQGVRAEYGESLNAVMGTTEAALIFWTEQRKSEVLRIAENEVVSSLTYDLNYNYELKDAGSLAAVRETSLLYISTIDNLQSHDGFQILSVNGNVLLSSNGSNELRASDIHKSYPKAINKALNGQTFFLPPIQTSLDGETTRATAFFLAPIYYENRVVGIIASAHYPENELSRIMSLGRMGKSGESYLLDRNANLVSRSRFLDTLVDIGIVERGESEILKVSLRVPLSQDENNGLTQMARSLTEFESAQNLDGYFDYRGVSVIGTWKWLPELSLGIATEIDLAEASLPYNRSRDTIILLVISNIVVAILLLSLLLFISNKAQLRLRKAAADLENKVKERTQELEASSKVINSERRMLQSILDNIPDPIFCKESDGTYIRVNKSFVELTGRSAVEIIGKNDKELYDQEDAEFFIKDDEKLLLTGTTHVVERPTTDAFGNTVLFETRKTLIAYKDGEHPGILGISRDITDRKRFEEAMLNATRSAQEASSAKSEFLARMSHEIRTPMNGVLGMIDLVLDSHLNSEQKHKLKVAKNSAASLLTIINDILDFSRVEAGKLALESIDFNLGNQIETIAQSMALRCDSKGVELIVDITAVEQSMVVGDPVRLRQILTNLINNAIKFTDKGQIVVRAKAVNDNGETKVECSIEDTGIGIPQEKLHSLFDSFTQVDSSTTRLYGGSGLGLAICERLVDLMGGEIQVESREGNGSKFTFTLTFVTSSLEEKPMPQSNISDWKVLVVDDNETNLEILENQLRSWKLTPIIANSASTALEILFNEMPELDLVITDMNMPHKDGLTLVSDIKLLDKYKDTKIMMLSSMSFQMSSDEFKSLGLDACLMKPVGTSELFNSLSLLSRDEEFISESTLLSYTNNESLTPVVWPKYHKVLIVEDNPVNQLVAEGLMNKFGLQYGVAVDGKVAISTLSESEADQPFTLILMDCQMPIMDGYRASEIIRSGGAGERYIDIPIIAMTANAMKGDREKCLKHGMNDHVAKPIDTLLLQKALLDGFALTPDKLTGFELRSNEDISNSNASKLSGQLIIPEGLSTMDWSIISPSLVNQPTIYIKSLKLFIKHYTDMQFAFPNNRESMDKLKHQLHSIKGSSGNIGLTSLYKKALELEERITSNQLVSNDVLRFNEVLTSSLAELSELIRVNSKTTENNNSTRSILEVLQEISPLVNKSELVPFELVEELARLSEEHLDDKDLHAIVEALEDFDYDKSKRLIEGKL